MTRRMTHKKDIGDPEGFIFGCLFAIGAAVIIISLLMGLSFLLAYGLACLTGLI